MILSESSHIFRSGTPLAEIKLGRETLWKTDSVPAQEIWYKTVSKTPVTPRNIIMASNQMTASGICIIRSVCPVVYIKDAKSYKTGCFAYTDLQNVWMPDGLKVIGARCFQGCQDLKSFTVGPGVTGIGAFAFSGCTGLRELVVLPETPPALGSGTFKDVNPEIPVFVENPEIYQGWGGFKNIIKL